MSVFTTEVRFICETAAGLESSAGLTSVNTIIDNAIPSIFDFTYPIFDETYRQELEHKILRHFYTREIGFETVGLWKLRLEDTLNLIMPYYNKLYESTLITYNPLYDIDYYKDGAKNENKNVSSKSNENENTIGNDTTKDSMIDIGSKDESKNKTNNLDRTDTNTQNNINTKHETSTDSTSETNSSEKLKNDNNVLSNRKLFIGTDTGESSENNDENKTGIKTNKSNTVNHNENNAWNLYSDTPQSGVIGLNNFTTNPTGSGTVQGNSYLTNATRDMGDSNGSSDSNASETNTNKNTGHKENSSEMIYNYDTNDTSTKTGKEVENKTDIRDVSGNRSNNETNTGIKSENSIRNEEENGTENLISRDSRSKSGNSESTTEKSKTTDKNGVQTSAGKQDYAEHVYGKHGTLTYSRMIEDFRKAIINVDMMVIKELEPLFVGLWE